MKILLACHDCEAELIIVDVTQSIGLNDITVCPVCGSDNINLVVKNNNS